MTHNAWQEFAKDIQNYSIHDVVKCPSFMSTMFCSSFVSDELDHLYEEYIEDQINKLVWEPIETMGEGNNIHQLYHLTKFLNYAQKTDFKEITEFGAGYGSMCVRATRLLRPIRYNIIDLPELKGLQEEYLLENEVNNVFWYKSFNEYLEDKRPQELLIALWSLSETPQETRNFILKEADFKHYLFAYGNNFYDMENLDYFNEFKKLRPYITWGKEKISFMNDQYYLMGKS